ncbi:hypothetical protein RSOLAG1IB_04746 [Rhizoctonia solani AG-1 IB]|uniref:Uncharacterized protein n=1 Tax=Thanatephorus cucumeris (strain AG1-IB / isolate 7/3/14) TaxID=1108050 RepID=A0A0B7FWC6_THACB|nr:hypothetical protein RSOLAG1IB_04746 [Rhizoctonia solani AG-1 IB]
MASSFAVRPRVVENTDGEGDYPDHLQQPNNTKKRKVPAATIVVVPESAFMRDNDDLIDEDCSQNSQQNSLRKTTDDAEPPTQESDYQLITTRRKPVSLVTIATLRLKELLRARRKIMAAAIRDDIDPLALDFALSAPFARPTTQPPSVRGRTGRSFDVDLLTLHPLRSGGNPALLAILPFQLRVLVRSIDRYLWVVLYPPTVSKRYSIAKKVASGLRLRFQTELARQATTAAELALKATSRPSNNFSTERKKADSGAVHLTSNRANADKLPKKPKKKKRSALANASNPHHLRNYVPSRVSHSGGHTASSPSYVQSPSNSPLSPLPLKFLSATLSLRQSGRAPTVENLGSSLIRPEAEWICPFCEYSLFYGDEAGMQRATRNRRKILIRRRNARERAAAAASGAIASKSQDTFDDQDQGESEDDGELFGDHNDLAPDAPLPQEVTATGAHRDRGPHPGG